MSNMVERVVEVIDEIGVGGNRAETHYKTIKLNELSSDLLGRYKKKAGAQSSAFAKSGDHKKSHKRYKGINTATTLQFRNDVKNADEREKEADRKDKKEISKQPLKWDGQRWVIRKRDSQYYQDKIKGHQSRKEDLDSQVQQLAEISIRTVGIGLSLATIKGWANKIDSGIQKEKTISNQMKNAKDDAEWRKLDSEWKSVNADVDIGLRKMLLYLSLLTTSGVVGLEKTLTKKLKPTKRR
jgi:hypothetical protein